MEDTKGESIKTLSQGQLDLIRDRGFTPRISKESQQIDAILVSLVNNAHLIAQAPRLYEACKQALRTFEAHGIKPTDPSYILLEQALAEAE